MVCQGAGLEVVPILVIAFQEICTIAIKLAAVFHLIVACDLM